VRFEPDRHEADDRMLVRAGVSPAPVHSPGLRPAGRRIKQPARAASNLSHPRNDCYSAARLRRPKRPRVGPGARPETLKEPGTSEEAGATGLEPATSGVTARLARSIYLRRPAPSGS
jgi:hypothetical protein